MLRLVALAVQMLLLLVAAYNAVIALWGWRNPTQSARPVPTRRLRVVIPAHNEAKVLASLLDDLDANDYPSAEVWVIDDRSTDETLDVVKASGARVTHRSNGSSGKGAALAWFLEQNPLDDDEALVVLDADSRVPRHTLRRIAEEVDAGHDVIQCYLDAANPEESLLAEAAALSYWAGNRMVQLARSNLGWSADLGGTGMAISKAALEASGGFSDSLVEDQELGIRLLLSGYPTSWLHDVGIKDEKPTSARVAVRQRARWMAGRRSARRKHTWALLRTGSPAALDLAMRLWQPGRSFVALVSGTLTILSYSVGSTYLLPWQVWGIATLIQVVEPLPFLAKDGIRSGHLLRYPALALLAALWLPIRLLSSRVDGWYHTPHTGGLETADEGRALDESENGSEAIGDVHDSGDPGDSQW